MTSSNVNTHFCKGELQRRYIAMKTDTVHMYCLSNSSAKVFFFFSNWTHSLSCSCNFFFFCISFFLLSLVTDISLRQSVSTFYETEYLTIFFCLFVDMHICTHTHTCKDICIRDSFYPHTIQFMHSSPTKNTPWSRPKPTPTLPNPHHNTPLVYIMSICIAHAHSAKKNNKKKERKRKKENKKKRKKKLQTYFVKRAVPFLSFSVKEIKGVEAMGLGGEWLVISSERRRRREFDFGGHRNAALLGRGVGVPALRATRGTAGERTELSCRPSFWQTHPFDGGALALVQGGPGQSQRWVELIPVLVAVAALVGAATTAQAIDGGASRVLARRVVLGSGYPATVAPRCAAGAISRRRNRFGLDVQALSRGQGEIWTLT